MLRKIVCASIFILAFSNLYGQPAKVRKLQFNGVSIVVHAADSIYRRLGLDEDRLLDAARLGAKSVGVSFSTGSSDVIVFSLSFTDSGGKPKCLLVKVEYVDENRGEIEEASILSSSILGKEKSFRLKGLKSDLVLGSVNQMTRDVLMRVNLEENEKPIKQFIPSNIEHRFHEEDSIIGDSDDDDL